jgi:hypothetical protein
MAVQEQEVKPFDKEAWMKGVQDAMQETDEQTIEQTEETKEEVDEQQGALSSESSEQTDVGEPEYEPSDADLQAMQAGWKPKHLYKGDPTKWKPAEEWLKYEPLKETTNLKKKNIYLEQKTYVLEQELEKLKKHLFDSAEKSIVAEKRRAIEESDPDEVDRYDKELAELYERFNSAPKAAPIEHPEEVKTAANDFIQRNQHWFGNGKDPESILARNMAHELDNRYFVPGSTDPETHFEFIEATLRKKFPNLGIGGVERRSYSTKVIPNRATVQQPKKKSFTVSDLSPEHKAIMNGLIRNGHTTQEKYIEYLAKKGELK